MRLAPGQQDAPIEVTFISSSGAPLTPDAVTLDIIDPSNVTVLNDAVPVETSPGNYQYLWDVPADAETGLWRAEWRATFGTTVVPGEEIFEVADPGVIVVPSEQVLISRLRGRLGEVPYDVMDDDAILDLIAYSGNDLVRATLEGWIRKAARYARLVDVSESGSSREMSTKFKNARAMVDLWSKVVGEDAAIVTASLQRIVGKSVNLGYKPDPSLAISPFNDYSDYVRMYPTHRLIIPAIL